MAAIVAESRNATIICFRNEDTLTKCNADCFSTYNLAEGKDVLVNTSNVIIHFCSSTVILSNTTVTITNVNNIAIGSTEHHVRVIGAGNSGFHLDEVHNVSIQNVEFIGCGRTFDFGSNDTILTAMLVRNSSSITLSGVSFNGGQGSGLIMLNIDGNTVIENCVFQNNIYRQPGSSPLIHTGGLHIQLSFCGWTNYKKIGEKVSKCRLQLQRKQCWRNGASKRWWIINHGFK